MLDAFFRDHGRVRGSSADFIKDDVICDLKNCERGGKGRKYTMDDISPAPIQSLTFNSRIPDAKLEELTAPAKILRIERGSWVSFMEFISHETAYDIKQRLDRWFEEWRDEDNERHELEHAARYRAAAEKCWGGRPGVPALMTARIGPAVAGTFVFEGDLGTGKYVFRDQY